MATGTPAPGGGQPSDDSDLVVLLDEDGTEAGSELKITAHLAPGLLHRAFSVFLFDPEGRLLLQRRSADKHLFAGLWSNSCCSHPRPGEAVTIAARRRVHEELGIECELEEVGGFDYHAHDPVSGLDERERVHVLAGTTGAAPVPDPREIGDLKLVPFDSILLQVDSDPGTFSPWLRPAASAVRPWWARTFGAGTPGATGA